MTIHAQVSAARQRLRDAGISPTEADLDARLLAQHVLGWTTERFLTDARRAGARRVRAAATKRWSPAASPASRSPTSSATREFWGLELEVTPDVLIPRPATELIVEAMLELFPDRSAPLHDRRHLHRLRLRGGGARARAARGHRQRHRHLGAGAGGRAAERRAARRRPIASTFTHGDLLDGIDGPFDAIVANPPYVVDRARPALQPEVRDHEPAVALFGGADGLTWSPG